MEPMRHEVLDNGYLRNGLVDTEKLLWYVIQTKPGDEHRVEKNFTNQHLETFLPMACEYRYLSGKMVRRVKPLFPNYIFTKLDIDLHYYNVRWTRGVRRILGTADIPVPISDRVVDAIRLRMGDDGLVMLDEDSREGELVQITSGPLKGLTGIFSRKISDSGRVRILVNLIGVDVPIQISKWQLKKVV